MSKNDSCQSVIFAWVLSPQTEVTCNPLRQDLTSLLLRVAPTRIFEFMHSKFESSLSFFSGKYDYTEQLNLEINSMQSPETTRLSNDPHSIATGIQ